MYILAHVDRTSSEATLAHQASYARLRCGTRGQSCEPSTTQQRLGRIYSRPCEPSRWGFHAKPLVDVWCSGCLRPVVDGNEQCQRLAHHFSTFLSLSLGSNPLGGWWLLWVGFSFPSWPRSSSRERDKGTKIAFPCRMLVRGGPVCLAHCGETGAIS